MSKSLSNPTTPVSVPQSPRMQPPLSPATIREMLANNNTNETTRIPQPANGSAAITIPKLRRSLSMRARISSSCSSNANTTTTATNHMTEVDDSIYGVVSTSSNSYSIAGITENNCKTNQRSPIGASCPAINKKGLPNGVVGNDCSITNNKHREHGMVIKLIKFLIFFFFPPDNNTC